MPMTTPPLAVQSNFVTAIAVSIITTSALLAVAELSVSKATEAGSAPIFCFTTGTPTRSPHITNCSTAAARKVSAAPR